HCHRAWRNCRRWQIIDSNQAQVHVDFREPMHCISSLAAVQRTAILVLLLSASIALSNHGPGTSGGGSSTASGETLKRNMFDLSLREDYTEFEDIGRAEAERRAADSGGFDAIRRSFIETFSIAYGISDDLQAGAAIGYYN